MRADLTFVIVVVVLPIAGTAILSAKVLGSRSSRVQRSRADENLRRYVAEWKKAGVAQRRRVLGAVWRGKGLESPGDARLAVSYIDYALESAPERSDLWSYGGLVIVAVLSIAVLAAGLANRVWAILLVLPVLGGLALVFRPGTRDRMLRAREINAQLAALEPEEPRGEPVAGEGSSGAEVKPTDSTSDGYW